MTKVISSSLKRDRSRFAPVAIHQHTYIINTIHQQLLDQHTYITIHQQLLVKHALSILTSENGTDHGLQPMAMDQSPASILPLHHFAIIS